MAQPKTKRPTGLAVKRSDSNFVYTWKIGDDNYRDGQTMQVYHQYNKKWANVTGVAWGTTKKTITIDTSKYYPNAKNKLTNVKVRIRGNRERYTVEDSKTHKKTTYDPTVSDWTELDFAVLLPTAPILKATLSNQYANQCTFEWTHSFDKTVHPWITDIQWQSILVKECEITDGSKLSWNGQTALDFREGVTTSSSSVTIDEDTSLLADASYTRWFRARSRGPAGFSDWKYVKHVYAKPSQAVLKSAGVVNTSDGGYLCKVVWRANAGAAHPIDYTTVQYVITEPVDGLNCPEGLSWTDAFVARDTSDLDAASFSIGNVVENDQCLFVRVNTTHDRPKNTTNGRPQMVVAGNLSDPDGLQVNMPDTRIASVTANNNALQNNQYSFLAVVYMTSNNPEGFIIGVIPHGKTSTTVQAPPAVAGETVVFGVYAVLGEYSEITRGDGVTSYAIDKQWLRSKGIVKQGGDIPLAPSDVMLAMTDTVGTIRVTFNWDWRKATAAELSWADHIDAWESTAKPSTFVIDNTHAGAWNISGLATGKTWYVRVRLTSGSGDGKTYGAYSDIASIDLSSAPAIPVLTLTSGVITEEGTVTASWSYASGDGTAQANAEVAEVTTEGGTRVYTPVATTNTATNVAINAETVGWQSGELHTLVVRVVSDSGRQSDWSDPVSVAVAEPITAEITQTSLVEETVEENPRTFTGDVVSYNADITGPVTSLKVALEPVQSGSGDPSPSNVRAISGWDSVKVTRTGKNLLPKYLINPPLYNGVTFTVNSDGSVNANGTASATCNASSADITGIGGEVVLSGCPSGGSSTTYQIWIYDKTTNASTAIVDTGNGSTGTLIKDHVYSVRIRIQSGYAVDKTFYPMLRFSSDSDTYEPYNGNAYDISLASAGTVYGGTLDVVSGVLTVDRRFFNAKDKNWSWGGGTYAYTTVNDTDKTQKTEIVSSTFKYHGGAGTVDGCVSWGGSPNNGNLIVRSAQVAPSLSDWNSYIASNDITFVYYLAEPQTYQLTPQQITSLLGDNNVWSDAGPLEVTVADEVRDVCSLTEMPLSVTVEGAGEGGTTSVIIERAEDYHVDRPDETEFHGFEGETIAIYTQTGENPVAFDLEDLLGSFDDEASYRIIATVQDGLGQSAEVTQDFEVHWDHQASIPTATFEVLEDDMVTVITPNAQNAVEGDVCDIYRLSVDKPELIYPDAEFGTSYVDPYPAIGEFGGHRIVFKTANGDYITQDNKLAWCDLVASDGNTIDSNYTVIDFDRGRILINRNLDIDNSWKKDFKETQYLGGSVQGDWNPAVSREAKVSTVAVSILDQQTIQAMRRLAVHTGICHVRTSDGSSYACNIEVSDSYSHDTGRMVIEYELSITRVESEGYDGMTLAEWNALHTEE